MEKRFEYQIFIGCFDSQLHGQLISGEELRRMVGDFFSRNEVDFSMLDAKGGYLHRDGSFVIEDSICISIVGDSSLDIERLADSLSMFMNQESVLIIRNALTTDFL